MISYKYNHTETHTMLKGKCIGCVEQNSRDDALAEINLLIGRKCRRTPSVFDVRHSAAKVSGAKRWLPPCEHPPLSIKPLSSNRGTGISSLWRGALVNPSQLPLELK